MTAKVFDHTPCALGEGPLWHPERKELLWFDILRFRLHAPGRQWQFDEHVSAAGWINPDRLLIASETRLFLYDLETGDAETLVALEADNPVTRSNDGRVDPWGGFWIGTMGKSGETGAGAIYRYYKGEIRVLFPGVTIPNAICFAPDGAHAYFADTRPQKVWRQRLSEPDGWPEGDPEVFLDLAGADLSPDGAVVDQDGVFWNAQWGAGRVAAYAPDGTFLRAVEIGADNTTCPAFGGAELSTLYCTSARQALSTEALGANPDHGKTFGVEDVAPGQAEHRVIL